jgi:D-glycero-alpha-D-manno-heptose 1-phosphate guanylyltransferase
MIPVAGEPFLEWVIRYWVAQGFRRFVVSLGHLAEAGERFCAARRGSGLEIETVVEPEPLGTGGAIHFAAACKGVSDPFAAANGDSLVVADMRPALELMNEPDIDGVLLGVPVPDAARYGSLVVEDGRLVGFREKRPGSGMINGGVYLLRRRVLDWFPPQRPLSIESETFPALLAAGAHFRVLPADAPFLDIGTPESIQQAESFIGAHFTAGRDTITV